MAGERLRVSEIFYSLQGEARATGLPTVFLRLTGCPLRCSYCDTTYAFQGGESLSIEEILSRIEAFGVRRVCLTGGEPLAQRDSLLLMTRLCDARYEVSLETSGALDIAQVDPRVERVVDLKSPTSGEEGRNRYANIELLTPKDQVKIVLCSRADYEWAREIIARYRLPCRCEVLLSPAAGSLAPALLAEWILEDRLEVRFQLQLHKTLWGDQRGR